jgi:aminoglycoside phosphotransferase (APT) family kinase protein
LIHNDVAPQNIGLPYDLSQSALLVDWEMAGWGLPELDLAYMFLLPFRNTQRIDRSRALEVYWHERQALEGACPPPEERCMVQHYADAWWALRQLVLAQRVALTPFPAGSAPQAYWDAMYCVLQERLQQLCAGI